MCTDLVLLTAVVLAGVRLYQPLQASCLSEWGLLDWVRFMAIKHAMDSLLVSEQK